MKMAPYQLYGEDGKPLKNQSAFGKDVFSKGLLHGAAHVWFWRDKDGLKEVLLQKRAAEMRTWPNRWDISAAGHVELNETPIQAALRETKEELSVSISASDLTQIKVNRTKITAPSGDIENEFQWIYIAKIPPSPHMHMQPGEVDSLAWLPVDEFAKQLQSNPDKFIPHGQDYFELVISSMKEAV